MSNVSSASLDGMDPQVVPVDCVSVCMRRKRMVVGQHVPNGQSVFQRRRSRTAIQYGLRIRDRVQDFGWRFQSCNPAVDLTINGRILITLMVTPQRIWWSTIDRGYVVTIVRGSTAILYITELATLQIPSMPHSAIAESSHQVLWSKSTEGSS